MKRSLSLNKLYCMVIVHMLCSVVIMTAMENGNLVNIPSYFRLIERWKIDEMKSFALQGNNILANDKGQTVTTKELYLLDRALEADKKNQFKFFCEQLAKDDTIFMQDEIGEGNVRKFVNACDKAEVTRLRRLFVSTVFPLDIQGRLVQPMIKAIINGLKDEIIKKNVPCRGTVLPGHLGMVSDVAFSPDNSFMASASGGVTNNLMVWDCVTKELLNSFDVDCCLNTVTFSHDNTMIAAGGLGHYFYVWNISGALKKMMQAQDLSVSALQFSHNGKMIVSGHKGEYIRDKLKVWDLATGVIRKEFGTYANILFIAINSDDTTIVSVDRDAFKNIKVWDIATGQQLWSLRDYSCNNYIVECKVPDAWLIGGYFSNNINYENHLTWYDLHKKESLGYVSFDDQVGSSIFTQTCCPNGFNVAPINSTDMLNVVKMWSSSTGQELAGLQGHDGDVISAAYSSNGKKLLSGSMGIDNNLMLWELLTNEEENALKEVKNINNVACAGLIYDSCCATPRSDVMQLKENSSYNAVFALLPKAVQNVLNSLLAPHVQNDQKCVLKPKSSFFNVLSSKAKKALSRVCAKEPKKEKIFSIEEQKKLLVSEMTIKSHFLPKEVAEQEIDDTFPEGIEALREKREELIIFVNSPDYGSL